MIGEYTDNVLRSAKTIQRNEYVTSDGEVIKIDKRVAEHIAMDLENIKEESLVKVGNPEYRKSKYNFNILISDNCGGFYFMFQLLLKLDIDRAYITRFIYLCTFADYEGKLRYGSFTDNNLMYEKDLLYVLRMGSTETKKTKKVLIDNNLIFINENKSISINEKYCTKGKINTDDTCKKKARIFESTVRRLYESSPVKSHSKLGIFFELIPFVNYKFNTICSNVDCRISSEIEPLSFKQICSILGYSLNQSSRLKKELRQWTIDDRYILGCETVGNVESYVINPKIYYMGTLGNEDLDNILGWFDRKQCSISTISVQND